jgi:hypothetical protein
MGKLTDSYNLQKINPRLSKEWHPTQNGTLTPKNVTPVSGRKVGGICNKQHEWLARSERKKYIPRKIWILWHQGLSEAPFIIRRCIDSWVKENPSWEVVILDKDNLAEYIVLDLSDDKLVNLSLTKQSNLVRLQLLSEYGGVWADATTLCMRPLDDWIYDCYTSGFFAFYKPGRDRIVSTWFIACKEECPIVLKLRERYVSFFMKNDFNNNGRFKQKIIKWLSKILNRSEKTTMYWFSPVVIKLLRVYPYFIFHYMFERLVSSDSECQIIWNKTKKISADGPHKIQKVGLFSPVNKNIINEINEKLTPIYKLTWKYDHSKYSPSSVLYYLLEGRHLIKETYQLHSPDVEKHGAADAAILP